MENGRSKTSRPQAFPRFVYVTREVGKSSQNIFAKKLLPGDVVKRPLGWQENHHSGSEFVLHRLPKGPQLDLQLTIGTAPLEGSHNAFPSAGSGRQPEKLGDLVTQSQNGFQRFLVRL